MAAPIVSPEWLGQRLDRNPDKWRGREAAPLIAATMADPSTGRIAATRRADALGSILRTYALVAARFGMTADLDTISSETQIDRGDLEAAHVWWLQEMTNRAEGTSSKAWNDGTGSALAASLEHETDPARLFDLALEHLHTGQATAIMRAIGKNSPETRDALQRLRRKTRAALEQARKPDTRANCYNYWQPGGEGREHIRHDERELVEIAKMIEAARRGATKKRRAQTPPGAEIPEPEIGGLAQWEPIIAAKNRLERPHVGKIGSKRRAADTGRTIRYPSRALTDPSRRIFDRRQRAKDALVVLDLSGSMNYSIEQIDEILEAARGAVVVGYSSHPEPTSPNFWLLARDGQRVADLPDVPGGNGCDGTALEYAIRHYRKRPTTPIIWVSDGGVHGKRGADTHEIADDMIRRITKHKAHQVETMNEALALFERMGQGHRPGLNISRSLLARAGRRV